MKCLRNMIKILPVLAIGYGCSTSTNSVNSPRYLDLNSEVQTLQGYTMSLSSYLTAREIVDRALAEDKSPSEEKRSNLIGTILQISDVNGDKRINDTEGLFLNLPPVLAKHNPQMVR